MLPGFVCKNPMKERFECLAMRSSGPFHSENGFYDLDWTGSVSVRSKALTNFRLSRGLEFASLLLLLRETSMSAANSTVLLLSYCSLLAPVHVPGSPGPGPVFLPDYCLITAVCGRNGANANRDTRSLPDRCVCR